MDILSLAHAITSTMLFDQYPPNIEDRTIWLYCEGASYLRRDWDSDARKLCAWDCEWDFC